MKMDLALNNQQWLICHKNKPNQYAKYLTVKPILINCDRFFQIRPKYYQTNNIKDLFKNTISSSSCHAISTDNPEEILSFLRNQSLHQNLTKYNKI